MGGLVAGGVGAFAAAPAGRERGYLGGGRFDYVGAGAGGAVGSNHAGSNPNANPNASLTFAPGSFFGAVGRKPSNGSDGSDADVGATTAPREESRFGSFFAGGGLGGLGNGSWGEEAAKWR